MAFCLAELHLWSTKSSLQVKDTDIGTHQYYHKGEPVADSQTKHYYNDKLKFSEARGYSWTPQNRRPEKLRDSLKGLEELLQTKTCVHTRWKNKQCCQLMLSSGVLITLTLNGPQLERVCIDHALVGRLPGHTVTDAVLTDRLLLLSFLEQSQVGVVYLGRRSQGSPEVNRRQEKLSASEMKVVCVELGSGSGRRLVRRVTLNPLEDVAVCWWPQDDPSQGLWPSALGPAHTDTHNLVMLGCSSADTLKVLSSVRTEGQPLHCHFSQLQPHQLLTVELRPRSQGETSWAVDACAYDCAQGLLQRTSVTRIPLQAEPISCSRHPAETLLLLGLSDSSLVLYDQRGGGTCCNVTCTAPPAFLAWHPSGGLVVVGGGQGELMCFDVGLAPLGVRLVAEELANAPATLRLSEHLRCTGGLEGLHWGMGPGCQPEGCDLLMLALHGGPLAALKFRLGVVSGGGLGPSELLQERLRWGQVGPALGILKALDWDPSGEQCYRGLSLITIHLLRLDLNAEREAQLEAALGVFYAPPVPLPDAVVLDYREPISSYARRFFHHLIRHQRLEKAFLLAVDLRARDLFMDLHYVAVDKGEMVLADAARRKAREAEFPAIAAATEESSRGRSGMCSLSLSDRHTERPISKQTERDKEATDPALLLPPTARVARENNHARLCEDDLLLTIQGWSLAGTIRMDEDEPSKRDDPGTLEVIDLGRV
ncbi:WD repeat-containing and planar cell polarity effector protein fritz homolog isoform X2 [Gadus chalcogrammus]|uniref:WD repeat-containing and planar cell polarity effector protein fritz homolog isoform X2 n=1 Tax=Gadus chalcogrammus TaxID=1042646 RepID=UPI0024C48CCB|nr:WD repeat-containing and planar cell polarity effector protein fritz homolog isoform X2 [Gadus chalcogrammus]